MVTQITLGNIYQQGGKTIVGGGQTGFDTESIIKSLVEVKRLPAATLEATNKTIDSKQSTYSELKKMLDTFRSAVDVLRNPPGVNNAAKNIFQYRTATATSSTATSASTFVNVTAQPGAQIQDFTITNIQQLAKEAKQFTGDFLLPSVSTSVVTTAATAGYFKAGTFTLDGIDGQADASITLANGDTLEQVVSKFNAVKSVTGIEAAIVTVATGTPNNTYKINFTGTKTGQDYDFDFTDTPGGVGSKVTADASGVLANVTFAAQTQAGQNAIMVVDGITINRATNGIDDVIDGITFNLKQPTAGAVLTVSIDPDTQIVANAITKFADSYNDFKLFQSRQNQRDENGNPLEGAVLAQDTTLRTISDSIVAEASRIIDGIASGNPDRLIDIGLSFENYEGDDKNPETKNILVVDQDKLTSKLSADYDAVRGLFEYTMTSSDTALTTFKRTNALDVTSFTLNINRATNTYQATYSGGTANFDFTALAGGGVSLKGQAGTVFEGLELVYSSSSSNPAISVTVTQGIGDRVFNALEGMLDEDEGLLTVATETLADQKTNNEEEIDKIDEQVNTYRDQITQQYATLESALTRANQLLALLDAQANARNNA